MKRVWVIMYGSMEDGIIGVFSSKELAEAAADKFHESWMTVIHRYTMDEVADDIA